MIYLDNAATSRPKPPAVIQAVNNAMHHMASPGRGGYRDSMLAAETVYTCRERAAALFSMDNPENVIFTLNATHALNIAIKGLSRPGCRIVLSGYEHNSVLRPVNAIPGAHVEIAGAQPYDRDALLASFRRAVRPGTDLVVCNYVSNVFGCILPAPEICAICRERNVPCVVDAAQAAGIIDVNMKTIGADAVCMPGHKGLYGPQGTGLLLLGSRLLKRTIYEGGTGSESDNPYQPESPPERFESGTPNIPGIAGLSEGLLFVKAVGTENILRHERSLRSVLVNQLGGCKGIKLFGCKKEENQTGVLSFFVEGQDCETVAERLGRMGFAVRAGLHCAPLAHRSVGTFHSGTVRFSPGVFNTKNDILSFAGALYRIRGSKIY